MCAEMKYVFAHTVDSLAFHVSQLFSSLFSNKSHQPGRKSLTIPVQEPDVFTSNFNHLLTNNNNYLNPRNKSTHKILRHNLKPNIVCSFFLENDNLNLFFKSSPSMPVNFALFPVSFFFIIYLFVFNLVFHFSFGFLLILLPFQHLADKITPKTQQISLKKKKNL